MNIDNNLILIKGEDKTTSVTAWRFDQHKPVVFVTYNGQKEYPYNTAHVEFFKNPQIVLLEEKIVLRDGELLSGAAQLQFFGKYCRIVYKTGYRELAQASSIRVMESAFRLPKSKNCFEYLKEIAIKTGLIVEGRNILADRYEKIDFVRKDSVLAAFLSGKYEQAQIPKNTSVVYPFGFNLSQKKAVDNALCNQISIIEGPPGTGKTQTILNIIANAVMRGESVAVVSSNNSATANVLDKLKKYGVDFIAAPLGNSSNKEAFIESQNPKLPDMKAWREASVDLATLRENEAELDKMLDLQNELSAITAEQDALEKEFAHFKDYYDALNFEGNMPAFSKKTEAAKILAFTAEYELLVQEKAKLGFFKKLALRFARGLKNFRFYGQSVETVTPYCQNIYYGRRLAEIKDRRIELQAILSVFDFEAKMKRYSEMSMAAFKASLARKYGSVRTRTYYKANDLWRNSASFIKDYPVVLSTTYSLRASLANDFVYDYVIVDEASQVDLATGALALSCAKKTVIVGDRKQLPNVVSREQKEMADRIFERYGLAEAYRYSENSLLSAVVSLFPKAPRVLLKEHYRCHPEIIGFCNQRFYHNELIVLTQPKEDLQPLMVYRTAPGNHARGHINRRQIDVIVNEVFPNQKLNMNDGSVGIVTPYRNQADELQRVFANTAVKADTADKFQGQERSVMIFSTVDNEIGEFASDPNRLNVAVSRAVDRFIVVTDGNDNDTASPIHELIGYIQYHNHEIVNSEIHSVFDYLYHNYAAAREEAMRKYGRVSEVDSENLMYAVIRDVLCESDFSKYDVVMHVPLRMILSDLRKLDSRELSFATNHLTHVDFLIFSRLTHRPILVVEVDGFAYHHHEKQRERDLVKNTILEKYGIPILRLSTVGSREKQKLVSALEKINVT
jgi:superfamily I DNA and/or RNA helicase